METIIGAIQLRLLSTTTASRADRLAAIDWEQALYERLAAVRDYAPSAEPRYIVFAPGTHGYCEITTLDTCTCAGHKVLSHCPHCELIRRLSAAGKLPGTDHPIHATDIEQETAA